MIGIETERKFLVNGRGFEAEAIESHRLAQGYICRESGRTVRVRIADDKAFLTIKGPGGASGMSRLEWEMAIPVDEARALLGLCQGGIIEKTRYIVPASGGNSTSEGGPVPEDGPIPEDGSIQKGRKWEVDVFHGDNEGLVVAEIELGSPDESFARPQWLAEEVTGDRRYYNSMLAANPYSRWPK